MTGIGNPLSIILVIAAALSSVILSLYGSSAALIISFASYGHLSSDAGLPQVLSNQRIFPQLLLDSWYFNHLLIHFKWQIVVSLAFLMVKVTFPPPNLQISVSKTNYALVIEWTCSAAHEISDILLVVTAINRANIIIQGSSSSILSINSTLRRIYVQEGHQCFMILYLVFLQRVVIAVLAFRIAAGVSMHDLNQAIKLIMNIYASLDAPAPLIASLNKFSPYSPLSYRLLCSLVSFLVEVPVFFYLRLYHSSEFDLLVLDLANLLSFAEEEATNIVLPTQ
ncbi:MAG: hypothetical protein EZS28_017886, partial [Streblomastix strix]